MDSDAPDPAVVARHRRGARARRHQRPPGRVAQDVPGVVRPGLSTVGEADSMHEGI